MGRDLLARLVWGSRTSILVALVATFFSLLIGVIYGAFSGLAGGRVDNLMMRVVDVLYSIPFIFVVIFLITLIGDYRDVLEGNAWLKDRKSTRLNSSHVVISYAVFCLKKKKNTDSRT